MLRGLPHSRYVSALATLALLAASLGVGALTATAASAATKLCSGSSYSTCVNAGYTDHGYGTHSGTSYWGADPGHNCTNYIAYVETKNHVTRPSYALGNAWQWWSEANGHVTESTTTPVVGSVAWWGKNQGGVGPLGHVAYIEAVSGSPGSYTITISEDAAPSGPFDWMKISQGDPRWPGGFIYFDNLSPKGSDFTGDGLSDIAWHQGSTLFMLRATGNGTFSIAGSSSGIGTANWAGIGVDDNTHTPEAYWYQASASTIYVLKWAGTGWAIAGSTGGIGTPDAAVSGDYNGDGLTDIAWHQGSTLFMLRATGNGTFSIAGSSGGIGTPDWSGGGINDNSGKAEVYWHQASTLYVLTWGGSGWGIAGSTGGIGTPDAAVSGDYNGDGLTDIAWHQGSTLFMLRATGNGTFSIAGSSGGIGTPDWSGGGINDNSGKAEVYWHQASTLYVLTWGGSGWGIAGSTGGIDTPDAAASSST